MASYNGKWVFDFITAYGHAMFLGNKKGKILQSLQVIVKGNACIFNITS